MLLVDKHKFFSFYMNSKGENPKRRRRMKKTTNSNSKVFKFIMHCLKNGLYLNVLSWAEEKGVFKVIFLHKNNPKWTQAMLSLFKATEKIISAERYKKYSKRPKYLEDCKTRFRANLKKLMDAGALKFLGEKTRSDRSKERSYKIVDYSEKFLSDLLKDSKVGEIIENIREMDVNTREENVEVESEVSIIVPVEIPSKEISHYLCLSRQVVPQRYGDTSSNDFIFPQENVSFIGDPDPIQMQTEHIEEPTLNMLNTADNPALDNVHMENMFVRTVSVPNSEISAIPQNNIVQTMPAHNSGVMQSSPLCCNLDFFDFQNPGVPEWHSRNNPSGYNELEYATLHSPGETNFTKGENDHYDDFSLPKYEESCNLTNLGNATWSQDLMSSFVPKMPLLSSTVGIYNEKANEYPDMWRV